MALLPLTKGHRLLLLFKDDLPLFAGRGFPLLSKSRTILHHLAITNPAAALQEQPGEGIQVPAQVPQQPLFPDQPKTDPLWPDPPAKESCVWGWWRKPWEYHPNLFLEIQRYCREGRTLDVLLYTQYLRHIYSAKLHGLYFRPFLTSVPIPGTWYDACPSYYRDEPRLCGAFLLLEIKGDPAEDTTAFLTNLFVDSASFEIKPNDLEMVIPPDESIQDVTSQIIDKPFDRNRLRESDHTILLLRKFRQIHQTRKLLEGRRALGDDDLAAAFAETEWSDIRQLLGETKPAAWSRLAQANRTLNEIGAKARRAGSRITRFDLELAAGAFSSTDLGDLLVTGPPRARTFTPFGEALRRWVTSPSAADARSAAAAVFRAAWDFAQKRYGLSDLPGYFESLPALEAVASAVHYEIDRKFYRDHLSHNVRAALLAARLTQAACPRITHGVKPEYITFFSGLFHDIAFPISSFPDTVDKLASVLTNLQKNPSSFRSQGLVGTEFLQLSLHYVALLSAVPSLLAKYPQGCNPWDDPAGAISPVNARLLQELLLCAKAEDHAIISAAILFHRAVLARCKEDPHNIDDGVRTLMMHMTGPAATEEGKEFLGILQCIALHDRKASLKFHPVATYPRDAPAHLQWDDFGLPIIMSIADEFQEWGRPVGALEGVGLVDAKVDLSDGKVDADYQWNTDVRTFANVPYSLLYMLVGKLRVCGAFERADGATERPFDVACYLRDLGAFTMQYVAHRDFVLAFGRKALSINMSTWPKEGVAPSEYRGTNGEHLIRISLATDGDQGHDYLIIEGEPKACNDLMKVAKSSRRLRSIALKAGNLKLEFEDNSAFTGRLQECYFGTIEGGSPTGCFPNAGACTVFRVQMGSSEEAQFILPERAVLGLHLLPHPHFLDLDWRFTERTAKWVAAAAKHYADPEMICYLGCPTVALYHTLLYSSDRNWVLLDRGHFALSKWREGPLSQAQWTNYDVFDALPGDLAGRFAVVVTDPPWYEREYQAFCRRAAQLVRPDGFAFVSSYPAYPPYKPEKHARFGHILKSEFSDPTSLGSLEIDYEIPEFEKAWGGEKLFQHPGLRAYRPAYLDMYRARTTFRGSNVGQRPERVLPQWRGLPDGHHLRYGRGLSFPCKVRLERHRSVRRTEPADDLVGWTSRNAVVRLDPAGNEIRDMDALVRLIDAWERSDTQTPRRIRSS